jgi:hypothetical protein
MRNNRNKSQILSKLTATKPILKKRSHQTFHGLVYLELNQFRKLVLMMNQMFMVAGKKGRIKRVPVTVL